MSSLNVYVLSLYASIIKNAFVHALHNNPLLLFFSFVRFTEEDLMDAQLALTDAELVEIKEAIKNELN